MLENLLVHLLNTENHKVSKLFLRSMLSPLDFNLALWEAVGRDIIEIKEDEIKILRKRAISKPFSVMTDLQDKVYQTVKHYDKAKQYIPEVEFFGSCFNAYQEECYKRSDIIGALNWCEDAGLIHSVEAVNPIDADKPKANKFKFYYITEREDGVSRLFELANEARAKISESDATPC